MNQSLKERENQQMKRLGETNINNYGNKMTIIKYTGSNNIIVKFENGHITKTTYSLFLKGAIKSPYCKSTFGLGYLGVGEYKIKNEETNKLYKSYEVWHSMIKRCYGKKEHELFPTYKFCLVCDEWLNFQNFARWYEENWYEINNERMCLDKDILIKGNKIYSSETCVFVPNRINCLFTNCKSSRGEYPIGVHYNKKESIYIAKCHIDGNNKEIGRFKTPEDAFYLGYKPFKENYIKEVAEEYKDKIPKILYDAMYRYQINITD
jgi:hypothetical protein